MTDTILVHVAEVVAETPDIRTLRLEKSGGEPFGPFEAGAHIDVVGPTGILRQYSLASSPKDPASIMIAVKREPESRGGSAALHKVSTGDHLKIGRPRNLLSIVEDAERHILVAGGIGVTPLLSMAYELHSRAEDFELHYFARSRAEMAFHDLLENRAEFRDRVNLHFGLAVPEQERALEQLASGVGAETHAYTCGPAPFMDQVQRVLGASVGEDHVHIEHFVAAEVDTSDDGAFTVELDTGEVFEVPADRSILSVLEEGGVEVFKSCEEGICGSCVSGVLEGTPDHRDNCLSSAEKAAGDQMALCVSRAKSDRLLIELY